MGRASVSFVTRKSIFGVNPIELYHNRVSSNLRQNRRGRNGKAQPVSFYDSFLARQCSGGWLDGVEYNSRNDLASINKDTIGLRLKIPPGFDHCAETRCKNINPVNFFNLHHTQPPTQRL